MKWHDSIFYALNSQVPFKHMATVEDFFTTKSGMKERWEALDQLIFTRTDSISDKRAKPVSDFVNMAISSIFERKLLINAAYPNPE
jgi:hypothetical protein